MADQALTFGRYRLEPRVGLMCGEREVHLTPKALALLAFMAGRPGEVVTKEELFGAVWPEVAVGDAALVTCIQELRKALGDDARRPHYVETLHRRGYRTQSGEAPLRENLAAGILRRASWPEKAGPGCWPKRSNVPLPVFVKLAALLVPSFQSTVPE